MWLEMTSSSTTYTSPINTYLTSDANSCLQEVQNLLCISAQIIRIWAALGTSIASVIPNENIHLFIQKVLQVIRMRIIYHLLVAHGIWVAKDEGVHVKISTFVLEEG